MCHHRRRCGRECSRRCACCATEYIQEFFLQGKRDFISYYTFLTETCRWSLSGLQQNVSAFFASIKMAVSVWRLHFAFLSRLGRCISTHLKLHGPLDAMLLIKVDIRELQTFNLPPLPILKGKMGESKIIRRKVSLQGVAFKITLWMQFQRVSKRQLIHWFGK